VSDSAPQHSPRILQQQDRRVPPHDYEAERAVLGAVLLDGDALQDAVEILLRDDFYRKAHATIFDIIIHLYNKGVEVDLITVSQELKQEKLLENVGGSSYLAGLTEAITSGANALYFAEIVKDLSLRRRLLHLCGILATRIFNLNEECRAILDSAEGEMFTISQETTKEKPLPASSVVKEVYELVISKSAGESEITGISSGFIDLDALLSGFHNAEFIVIGARPSVGKTALALNIISHVAIESAVPTAFFSLEMTAMAIVQRMLSSQSGVSATKIRTGILSHIEKGILRDAVGPIYSSPLWIVDTPQLLMMDLRAISRRLISEEGVRIIFIDYLTLITSSILEAPRHDQVAEISRSLKAMARELNVPVVVLSQVTRDSEGKKPTLATIRESGSIEQDADVVLFLHRNMQSSDSSIEETPTYHNTYETDLIVAKQRNGPVGTIKLQFLPHHVTFKSAARI